MATAAEVLAEAQPSVSDGPVLEAIEGPDLGDRLDSMTDDAVAERLAQTSVELLARFGGREGTEKLLARTEALFRAFLAGGRLDAATTLAEELRRTGDLVSAAARAQVDEAMARLATAEAVAAMLDALNRRGPQAAALAPAPTTKRK